MGRSPVKRKRKTPRQIDRALPYRQRDISEDSRSGQEKLLENFKSSVDSRQLLDALESHPDNTKPEHLDPLNRNKWQTLAYMLTAPEWKSINGHRPKFSTLCTRVGISWKEVVNYFADYQRSMGTYHLMNHLPEAMQQVAEDSLRQSTYCPKCDGRGYVVDGY